MRPSYLRTLWSTSPVYPDAMLKDGWFRESEVMWPGQAMTLKCEEVLYEGRSEFQDILVFRSSTYGNVLVLDGAIQVTERDEHSYQEMITQVPMHAHPDPKTVLVIGGGDGGVVREVCRHGGVQRVVHCEIDAMVCEVSKKYLPKCAVGFDDPRVELLHMDAAQYVKEHKEEFDVVIIDSSDPIGPAESLFTESFYKELRYAMKPGGVMCNQGECLWLHLDLIQQCIKHCTQVFPSVDYCYTTIPTYPSGSIGFLVCSCSEGAVLRKPAREVEPAMQAQLKYYSSALHAASFVLPAFAEEVVAPVRAPALQSVCSSVAPGRRAAALAAAGVLLGAAAGFGLAMLRK